MDITTLRGQYRRHASRALATVLGHRAEVYAEGPHVYDQDGRAYLDCGGYAVFLLGHRHPAVVRAVVEQLDRQPLATGMMLNPMRGKISEVLAAAVPEGLDYVFFTNSGTEATELAIKLARLHDRNRLVAIDGAFHGMTMGAVSLAGNGTYRKRFSPLLQDVAHVPWGATEALDRLLREHPGRTCVFAEPIQGEGGIKLPPKGWLQDVAARCRRHDALLVFDEIQCGLGRAGAWWQCSAEGARPDVLLTGKVLGGGVMPIGALVATEDAWSPLSRDPFLHGSTFAGSPLQLAAASATLEVLRSEGLVARSRELGARLIAGLEGRLQQTCPGLVAEVRGRGLMIGIELHSPVHAGDLFFELLARRVVALPCSTNKHVLRLTPSALLSEGDIEWLLEATTEAGQALAARYAEDMA